MGRIDNFVAQNPPASALGFPGAWASDALSGACVSLDAVRNSANGLLRVANDGW